MLDLLFGCRHRHTSRVFTNPKTSPRAGSSYVVCLDCGTEFAYDMSRMAMGDRLPPASRPKRWFDGQQVADAAQ